MSRLTVVDHPVIRTKLTELRDERTDHRAFRGLVEEVAMLMTYEITRSMPTRERPVKTPLEEMVGVELARPVCLVPILRAGLGMTSGVMRLITDCRVGHVGLERNEETAEAGAYYHKLPPDVADCETIVTDPMLATGGSAIRCVSFLKRKACRPATSASCVSSPHRRASQTCGTSTRTSRSTPPPWTAS